MWACEPRTQPEPEPGTQTGTGQHLTCDQASLFATHDKAMEQRRPQDGPIPFSRGIIASSNF